MKKYISKFKEKEQFWSNGEKQVVLVGTDKEYTLTQPVRIFNEDHYTVTRAVACANFDCKAYEDNFFVFEVSYMHDGCCCVVAIDVESMEELLSKNLYDFISGGALKAIQAFFEADVKEVETTDKPYRVKVVETLSRVVEYPSAESMSDAVLMAEQDYMDEKIILDADDLESVDYISYVEE